MAVVAMILYSGNQSCILVHIGGGGCRCRSVAVTIRLGRGWRGRLVAPGESTVVKELAQKHNVGNCVVKRQDDLKTDKSASSRGHASRLVAYHGRENSLQNRPENVEDIAQEPDNDKLNRKSVGAASLEVLDDLRREYDNWRGVSECCVEEAVARWRCH